MMQKDSIANAVSLAGAGAAMMEIESILTIILVTTGIILNIMRMRDRSNRK
jgi:uncharacterized iron-regulated membrane protein